MRRTALLVLFPLALLLPGPGAAVSSQDAPAPVPFGEACGREVAAAVAVNCAKVLADFAAGPCAQTLGGWNCPFEFTIAVHSAYWVNAGGVDATLAGDCAGETVVAWAHPVAHRTDEVGCAGIVFVPDASCNDVVVQGRVAFRGQDAPRGLEGTIGTYLCMFDP